MAPQSSILAWRIPWTEELGEDRGPLPSMGSQPDMTEHALTRTSPKAVTVGELRKDSRALPEGGGGFSRIPQSLSDHVSDGKWEKPFGNRELDRKLNVLVDHFRFLGRLKSPDSECAVVVC